MMEKLLALFADILDYPGPGLAEVTRRCEEEAGAGAAGGTDAVDALREFRRFVSETPREKLEETYTETFDLGVERCPYVGWHLFGEGQSRSRFMQELNARYRARGFSAGSELPDHLPLMLRFVSACDDPAEREEILREAIEPAVGKMTAGAAASGYDLALKALSAALKGVRKGV